MKYQIAKLSIMVLLLLITPFLSSSMRQPYLYFLLNVLIIALGAEAGFLSSFKPSHPHVHDYQITKKQQTPQPLTISTLGTKPTFTTTTTRSPLGLEEASSNKERASVIVKENPSMVLLKDHEGTKERKVIMKKVVEKSKSEKIGRVHAKIRKVNKSPSTPSLFFIGGCEADHQVTQDFVTKRVEEEYDGGESVLMREEEEVDALSGQELYTKAEMFIGNFYKQLKIQREDSWKRLHDFYHKAF